MKSSLCDCCSWVKVSNQYSTAIMRLQTNVLSALAALVFSSYTVKAQSSTASACAASAPSFVPPALNLTAISASNGSSVLECWALPGFVASTQAGTVGALNLVLGDLAN